MSMFVTYTTFSAWRTTSTSTTTAAATSRWAATLLAFASFDAVGVGWFGLASELDRNSAVKDAHAVQVVDGTLGLAGG